MCSYPEYLRSHIYCHGTAIKPVSEGKVQLEPLQSKIPFDRYRQAYEYIDANRETTMKVLIDVQNFTDESDVSRKTMLDAAITKEFSDSLFSSCSKYPIQR